MLALHSCATGLTGLLQTVDGGTINQLTKYLIVHTDDTIYQVCVLLVHCLLVITFILLTSS